MITPSEGKSSVIPVPAASNMRLTTRLRRLLRRDPSLFFMPALLIVSLAITVAIHPQFSDFDLQSLAMGALPLAFAAAAQTVVVIAGGIDLSIGSVMAVTNVLAASVMEKASFGQSLLLAVAILMAGAAIGALNGLIVVLSRIPDVVATLTSGFIWTASRRVQSDGRTTQRDRLQRFAILPGRQPMVIGSNHPWDTRWFPHAFAGVMEQLQYALKTGTAPMLSASDNLKTMALVEAAYRSTQEARAVQLAEFGF
jgi:ribose/xylose/arabinose/galactoside ABC-type transport system permease subunit